MKIKKQNQILQMIEIITKSQYDCGKENCEDCEYRKEDECVLRQDANYIATVLVKNGFCRIPDGAVVLTPKERDDEMKATNEILAERDELKAEIERLKNANSELTDNLVFYKDKSYKLEKNIEKLKEENKKDFDNFVKVNDELLKANMKLSVNKKRAQIDVLNKVKNCREATDSDCYPYLERIVNKLIKEIEK